MKAAGWLTRAWSIVSDQLVYPIVLPALRLRLLALLLSAALVFMLFYLGSRPTSVGLFSHPWDKLVHYTFYGGLTGLFWVLWGGSRLADVAALTMAVGVGIADEWTQAYNPARDSSYADLLFDLLGALTAVWVLSHFRLKSADSSPRQFAGTADDR